MSIHTWVNEFISGLPGLTKTPVAHSLQKWRGLLKRNLVKHGVDLNITRQSVVDLRDISRVNLVESCSLCLCMNTCTVCPIYLSTGSRCSDKRSAFMIFVKHGNVEPMIDLLESLLPHDSAQKDTIQSLVSMYAMKEKLGLAVGVADIRDIPVITGDLPEGYTVRVLTDEDITTQSEEDRVEDSDCVVMHGNQAVKVCQGNMLLRMDELIESPVKLSNLGTMTIATSVPVNNIEVIESLPDDLFSDTGHVGAEELREGYMDSTWVPGIKQ